MLVKKETPKKNQQFSKRNKASGEKTESKSLLWLCGILLFTFFIYSNSLNNGFTNWDDDSHVTGNEDIKSLSPESIGNMFKPTSKYMYHPITILSYAVNYKFSALKPGGYHFTNLLFHLGSVCLVFYFMLKLFKRKDTAIVTALLFAVHPLATEPVNWISGRKDVLCTFFFLSSLVCYLSYLNKTAERTKYYLGAIFLFMLAMLSKLMAASLPFVLVLLDMYHSRKLTLKTILEKVPFLVIAVIVYLIPLLHSRSVGVNPDAFGYSFHKSIAFSDRIFMSCYASIFYILKTIIPFGLSAYHGFPSTENGLPLMYYLSPLIILAIAFGIYKSGESRKQIAFGFLFYFITISLVVHIIKFGTNIYLAERYAYIPSVGLIFLAGIGFNKAFANADLKNKNYSFIITTIVVIALSYLTYTQNKVWKDNIALWTNVIENAPNDYYGYFNRGNGEKSIQNHKAALADFNEAVRLNPEFMEAYYNRALVKSDIHDYKGSIADFTKAVEINPRYFVSWFNRGNSKRALNDFAGAIADYNEAIKYKPDYKEAFANRGNAKGAINDFAGSVEDFNKVIELNPNEAPAYANRGVSKLNMNDRKGACDDWQKAVSLGDEYSKTSLQKFCK